MHVHPAQLVLDRRRHRHLRVPFSRGRPVYRSRRRARTSEPSRSVTAHRPRQASAAAEPRGIVPCVRRRRAADRARATSGHPAILPADSRPTRGHPPRRRPPMTGVAADSLAADVPAGPAGARCRREAGGLPGCGGEVERDHHAGPRLPTIASASRGTSRCGSTLVNQDPGPKHQPVGLGDRLQHRLGQAGGSAGASRTRATRPGGRPRPRPARGSGDVPAGRRGRRRPPRPSMSSGSRGHRQHPAQRAEHRAGTVQGAAPVAAVHLDQAGEHQVADRVAGQRAAAAEAVLEQPGDLAGCPARRRPARPAPSAGHPGGSSRHLAAQPAGRSRRRRRR